ncbi:MAG: hypothetical protein QOE61_898 [Micromonosporaceae bacterium]|jgi:hypothetical protein|nr:hypothetical protein [Micromonosporaceae bacterium]
MKRRTPVTGLIWAAFLALAVVGAFVVVHIATHPGADAPASIASPTPKDGSSVTLTDTAPSAGFLLPGTPPARDKLPESCDQARTLRRQLGGYNSGDTEMGLRVQSSPTATLEITEATVERLTSPAPATTYRLYCNDMVSAAPKPASKPDKPTAGGPSDSPDDESDGERFGGSRAGAITVDLGGGVKRPTATLGAPILLDTGAGADVRLNVSSGDQPYAWRLHLTLQSDTDIWDAVIDDHGKPFGTAPVDGATAVAADVAGEGWSDVAGLPNVFTVPGTPITQMPDLKLSLYAGFGSGAAPEERVGSRQVAWRRVVRGDPPRAPQGMTCAQLYHWLQSVDHVTTGGEPVVLGAANSGDVNSGAVIQDVHLRVVDRQQVSRSEQTVVECLQPDAQKSSGLANYRVDVYPGVVGQYATSFTEATGTDRILPNPPALTFGNTAYRVFPHENDVWQSFVLDLDIRYGATLRRVTLDDGGKPFTSGSAWDGTAGRTLAYCADAPGLGWTNPKSACKAASATPPAVALSADLKFLVGEWGGRYRDMTVNPDGTGEIKLGNPPDDPSKPAAEGTTTILGIQVEAGPVARITRSNDPAVPVGGRIAIRKLSEPGMVELTIPDRTWGTTTMCNAVTAADATACG